MKPRIYIDTSVIGGCVDSEFQVASLRLIRAILSGRATMVLSELTARELAPAPVAVKEILAGIPSSNLEYLSFSAEADDLAQAYLLEHVVTPSFSADALHIAHATVARVDVLVSWNFRHIVNLQRIHAFNAVNLKRGYPLLEIRSPLEVFADE